MRIGLIGWYGHDNQGDERILYCIKKYFEGHDFFITQGWDDAKLKMNELNKCDYILIGGGGLILANIGQYIDVIQNLKTSFGFIGVGIEARQKNMESFFKIMKQRGDFIYVRDKQSRSFLNNHYKVILGPDISFLYPYELIEENKNDNCGINLRAWHYWNTTIHTRRHKMMEYLNNKSSLIRRVYPFRIWDPSMAMEVIKSKFGELTPIPLYLNANEYNDYRLLSEYFKAIADKFDIKLYYNIRYMVGMRYHSIVFAAQCGVPFVSLSYQPKNINFCTDIGMEDLSCDIYALDELGKKIDYMKDNYDKIRDSLIEYRERAYYEVRYIFNSLDILMKSN